MRIRGSVCFGFQPQASRRGPKLYADHSTRCLFLGYDTGGHGLVYYVVPVDAYNRPNGPVHRATSVIFHEPTFVTVATHKGKKRLNGWGGDEDVSNTLADDMQTIGADMIESFSDDHQRFDDHDAPDQDLQIVLSPDNDETPTEIDEEDGDAGLRGGGEDDYQRWMFGDALGLRPSTPPAERSAWDPPTTPSLQPLEDLDGTPRAGPSTPRHQR
ncbi:hypothetical protein HDU96_001487 [Phlyctochytrium bullatum]|nr:hypothetical protein HDU96_001487 [Phlyctochytrium bullatum]